MWAQCTSDELAEFPLTCVLTKRWIASENLVTETYATELELCDACLFVCVSVSGGGGFTVCTSRSSVGRGGSGWGNLLFVIDETGSRKEVKLAVMSVLLSYIHVA